MIQIQVVVVVVKEIYVVHLFLVLVVVNHVHRKRMKILKFTRMKIVYRKNDTIEQIKIRQIVTLIVIEIIQDKIVEDVMIIMLRIIVHDLVHVIFVRDQEIVRHNSNSSSNNNINRGVHNNSTSINSRIVFNKGEDLHTTIITIIDVVTIGIKGMI